MPFKISVEDLTFEFDFTTDSDNKEMKVSKTNVNDKTAVFTLLNFDNSLGSGLLILGFWEQSANENYLLHFGFGHQV